MIAVLVIVSLMWSASFFVTLAYFALRDRSREGT